MPLVLPQPDIRNVTETRSEADFFARHGYLVLKGAVPAALIDELAEWSKKRFWSPHGRLLTARVQDEWKACPLVRELATHRSVLEKLEVLYGRKPVPFQTLNFPVGTQQRTHSDTIHFHCFPQRFMCGVWVALEAVDERNGPLHFYPGSHRLPVLDCPDVGMNAHLPSKRATKGLRAAQYGVYEDAVQELITTAGLSKKTFLAEKGDAIVWAANLLHGGEPVASHGSTRMSQVTHYFFEGCRYYTPLFSDLPRNHIHFRNDVTNILTGEKAIQDSNSFRVGFFSRLGRAIDDLLTRLVNAV